MTRPVHRFHESVFKQNLELLKSIELRSGCKFLLAFKGYIPWHSANLVDEFMSGVAVSSLFEMRTAKKYFKGGIHTYCPGYIPSDFEELADNSEVIVFNSQKDLSLYRDKVKYSLIDLRVNLQHVIVDSQVFDGYNPNKPYSRFGVTASEIDRDNLDGVSGIHFHALNQQDSRDLREMIRALESKFDWLLKMPQITRLNLGGGHSITKDGYDIDLLVNLCKYLRDTYNVQVYLEPSEYVFYNVGKLHAHVLSIVKNEVNIAILDVSAKNHMPDILESPYYFSPVEDADYEGGRKYNYILAGPTCLTGDVIGKYSFDRELKVGDEVVFTDQTQYTVTQSHFFNGINKPSIEVIGLDGKVKFRKDYTYEDYQASF